MSLGEIITTTIRAGTVQASRRGFGIPLILAHHTVWSDDQVRSYVSYQGLSDDFPLAHPVNRMGLKFFQQSPRPAVLKVARLPTPGTAQVTLVDVSGYDVASARPITGAVTAPDGTVTAINVAFDTDLATTATALETALGAIVGLTAVESGAVVSCTADNPGELFFFDLTEVEVEDRTLTSGYATRLANVLDVDPDFYTIVIDNNSPDNMAEVATWASANCRLAAFGPQYTDPTVFGAAVFTAPADHTALMANDAALGLLTKEPRSTYKECAWLGKNLPTDPGSITWAYTQLDSTGGDAMTATERASVEGVTTNMNHYVPAFGVDITRPGKTFGGEFIDVVRGLAWLEARLQERLFTLLVNAPKVPYTAAGLGLVTAEVRGQLREAVDRGVLEEGFTVTVVSVADQNPSDRVARILRGVEFSARLQGAVHTINLIGTVTV